MSSRKEKVVSFMLRLLSSMLGKIPLFKDIAITTVSLSKSLNELIKAYTTLSKMVIEDRESINDLYQHIGDLEQERIEFIVGKASPRDAMQAKIIQKDPTRIDVSWASGNSDKKKLN